MNCTGFRALLSETLREEEKKLNILKTNIIYQWKKSIEEDESNV